MADPDPSDQQRPFEQRSRASISSSVSYVGLYLYRVISSPRFGCVLKVIIYSGIIFVFLTICRVVLHNQGMLVNLQGTVQDLSNKMDSLSAFLNTQQQVLVNLLSKFESAQDKNTQELAQSIKAVQQMSQSQRQIVANGGGGGLEKSVGKAVLGFGQFIAPLPIKLIMHGYDLFIGLATLFKK